MPQARVEHPNRLRGNELRKHEDALRAIGENVEPLLTFSKLVPPGLWGETAAEYDEPTTGLEA